MHKDIQTVRLPRQAQKRVLFAFAEFGTEEKCEEAKVRVIIHIVIFKCSRYVHYIDSSHVCYFYIKFS